MHHRGFGSPRPQVDEEVPLEEDARADHRGRVLVDRLARVVERHRDLREVGALGPLDCGHLADVDPRDPHGRVEAEVVAGLEDGVELERLMPGQCLGEREVDPNDQHEDRERAGADRADAALEAPGQDHLASARGLHHFPFFLAGWSSVTMPWLPGMLPID